VPTTVRRAAPSDHAAVADLTASVYRGEGLSSADYEPALRDVGSRAASATVLVGEVDGRLVGAVTVATRGGEWAEQSVAGEAVIRMLVVRADARGSGAGEALVRACLDLAGRTAARWSGCRRRRT
jgi:GNAT superfamily N-acetyltransferase